MPVNIYFKKVAVEAAKKAGKFLRDNFQTPLKVSYKKDGSLVTRVDLEAEKIIIQAIRKYFPSSMILSEEAGGSLGKEYTWIIDPLDGTTNYSKKFPFFSVSIALAYGNNIVLAVVLNPISRELYLAEKGKGAFLNEKRITMREEKNLAKALVLFNKGRAKDDFSRLHRTMGRIGQQCRTIRYWGSTSLELCYLAGGRADGSIDTGSNPWDYAAGILIVKEGGGKVTDFKGNDWQIGIKDVVAANEEIHPQLLKLLNK